MNTAPRDANNWGNIAVDPTDWIILLLSSKNSVGEALVTINVIIRATTADIPIAAVPEILINYAIINVTKAINKDGTNILIPSFSDLIFAKVSSSCFKVPIFICLNADKIPIITISIPTIKDGISLPNIKIADNIAQKADVPNLVLWFLSLSVY